MPGDLIKVKIRRGKGYFVIQVCDDGREYELAGPYGSRDEAWLEAQRQAPLYQAKASR